MAQTPEGQDTTPHHEDRSMNKRTNLLASLAIAIATMTATSPATYAQSPLPTAHVTIGLEEENQNVRERDGVAIIAITMVPGAGHRARCSNAPGSPPSGRQRARRRGAPERGDITKTPPPSRFEWKAIDVPSGDQLGKESTPS